MPKTKKPDSYCIEQVSIGNDDSGKPIMAFPKGSIKASTLVEFINKLIKDHGNLDVYYADGYDNALSIACISVEKYEDVRWEGAPKGKAIYLS